jgi:antagonist of KipI
MSIRVVKPGFLTTVQDRGRFGYAHLGISPCGAADALSLRIANLLVGNDEYAPALEMTLLGATLEFDAPAVVALSGASGECKVGSTAIEPNCPVNLAAGSILQCGSTRNGARCYLAVQGNVDVPLVLGSASTDSRGRFGGYEGRRLQTGDILRIGHWNRRRLRKLRAGALEERMRSRSTIRVTRGAQRDWFSDAPYANFLANSYAVSEQSDRAGLRLKGDAISVCETRQLLTDGIPLGAIQVPQDGQPIILFVDQQTTGGYPKIANVITADMHLVGQLRPRDELRFAEISIRDAVGALKAQERWLSEIWQD